MGRIARREFLRAAPTAAGAAACLAAVDGAPALATGAAADVRISGTPYTPVTDYPIQPHIDFADLGRQHGDDKDFPRRVRAIRMM